MLRLLVLLFSLVSLAFSLNLDENNETNSSTFLQEKSIFLSYESIPDKVYVGEIFPIKVKAIIANNDFEDITSAFTYNENVKIINPNTKWKWFSDNIFYNTFYMKVNALDAKLPDMTLSLHLNNRVITQETLLQKKLNIIQLNGTKIFSHVIAKNLKVGKYKTSRFDDKSLIIVLEIEAEQSNLNEFHLKSVIRDGIDTSLNNLPFYKIFYYAIIPDYQKKFEFTYFNSVTNKFSKISLPVVVNDDKVSTQIDLNPAQNDLQIYKDASYGVFAFIFLIFFIRRRKVVYLILVVAVIALFIYNKNPLNSIKIDKNSKIQILPTKKSTVFYVTDRTLYAQELDRRGEYIKILLPNGEIGWIKDNSVSEN